MFLVLTFTGLLVDRPAASVNDKSGNEKGNKLMMNFYEYQSTITKTNFQETQTIPQATTENQQINIATTVNEDTNNAQIIPEVTTKNQLPDISTRGQEETKDEQTIPEDTTDNNQHSDITTSVKEETTVGKTIPEVTTENQLADMTTTVKEESETTTTSYEYNPFSENFSLPNSTRQSSKLFKFKFLNSRVTISKPFNIKISNPFFIYTIKLTKSLFINTILPQLISLINVLRLIKSNFQFWINLISLLM